MRAVTLQDVHTCALCRTNWLDTPENISGSLNDQSKLAPADCDRISVPSLEGVRQLILGSVHSNAGAVVAAKQSYGRAIKHSRNAIESYSHLRELHYTDMFLCTSCITQV